MGVLLILAVLVIAIIPMMRDRAEGIRCANNMRSLHTSLANYVTDRGHWPQEPKEYWESQNNDAYEDWWIAELTPFGGEPKVWQCPTILRRVSGRTANSRPRIHYTPTMFDDKPFTPYKWKTQPWLIEIGNMHGHGALVCFPDGSVQPSMDISRGF